MSSKKTRVSCIITFNLINGKAKCDECAYILGVNESVCQIDSKYNINLDYIKNIEVTLFDACTVRKTKTMVDGQEQVREKLTGTRIYINTIPLSKRLVEKKGKPIGVVYECDCTGSEGALKFMNIHKGKRRKAETEEEES